MASNLPIDPTGSAATNLIHDELPVVGNTGQVRLFAPLLGAFFTESMVIIDLADGSTLIPDVDYYPSYLFELPSGFYQKKICGLIVITKESASNNLQATYQALGGFYTAPLTDVVNMIATLDERGHKPAWGRVADPVDEYPPTHYQPRLDPGVGFEFLTHALARVEVAIVEGDSYGHMKVMKYYTDGNAVIQAQIDDANAQLTAHINDTGTPGHAVHEVTPDQLNVYTIAEVDQKVAAANTALSARLTALEASTLAHTSRTDNPHQTNRSQLGMWSKAEVDARRQALVATRPTNVNGFWQVLVNSYVGSWGHYNDQPSAVFYSFLAANGSGRVGQNMYVNGALISDAANYHTNWEKRIQTGIMVPKGGSVTVVGSTGAISLYGLRFVPT